MLHDPAARDPRGFIIPSDQPDFLTATKFVNILIKAGVSVHRATTAFTVGSRSYPAGSYVVKTAQPLALAPAASRTIAALGREHVRGAYAHDVLFSNSVVAERMGAMVSGAAATLALTISCLGVFALLAHTVTRRSREIAIRMAIGARAGNIMAQFLVEAVVLASLGGLVGALSGLGLIAALGKSLAWPMKLDPVALTTAILTSALTGIAFGFVPARRAAALDPIVALRHE